jgi:hypothetical protein
MKKFPSTRPSWTTFCLFALLFSCATEFEAARAESVAPMALDKSFGNSGFAALPLVEAGAPEPIPLGFVRMPLSTGYMAFSVQKVRGISRIVGSRFTDEGILYTPWGTGGSQAYVFPTPVDRSGGADGDLQMRVTVSVENAVEVVYIAFLYKNTTGATRLLVARLGASGGILSVGESNVSNYFSNGPGQLRQSL